MLFAVAGCAVPSRISEEKAVQTARWTGRLSVRVEASPAQGPQAFSSSFELQGGPGQGQLLFFTPLGSTAAAIAWSPQQAHMQSGTETHVFSSITELIERVLGTPVPVAALFAWLAGEPLSLDGWQVDQSQFADGKITARRTSPSPSAEIRVVLEP
ncbi:outer membrane lipoprotein LolB [Rhodoferax sp.]|uniref:outer membrane lipoprotein LolB n=1 Tax=Rhodoferax sp. TaxID=50421 RepID=UPI00261AE8B0|nr:outer membrane lipoprotein LolB [Rhodoferax sp.]MDD3936825.1 lipoprotein insertase outer membrane protein LolB [Rhodoferax sp.]